MLKRVAKGVAAAALILAGTLVVRTLALPIVDPEADAVDVAAPRSPDGAPANRLAQAVRFETIAHGDGRAFDPAAFEAFGGWLAETYPAAHAAMSLEIVNGASLVYLWRGVASDGAEVDGARLAPIALIAHSDVVPVEPGTEEQWTHPPFAGVVADGFVWGRGSLDNKGQLIAIMEAAERLARVGFRPERDVYLLFGHDEELGGENGAAAIRRMLEARGVRFAFTLDEGSGLVEGIIPGAKRPVALVATAEKGSTSLRFTARAPGGHSSAPGPDTAVSLVSKAVLAASEDPYPIKADANVVAFLHALAGEAPFAQRLALANLWLTGPAVLPQLAKNNTVAASLRTTTAPTLIEGGVKVNVLPQTASAVVNYRIHPRDSVAEVRARAERQIAGAVPDGSVSVETLGGAEPSPQSSASSDAYAAIATSIGEVFGSVTIAPSLTLQGTDTRNYVGMADDHYRFTPFVYSPDDLARIHGTDERVSTLNLSRAIDWYADFIAGAAGEAP